MVLRRASWRRFAAGQVVVIEHEQADGENRGDRDDWNYEAIEADSGGFHGHNFAIAIEYAKCHQCRDQHGQRGNGIDHAGREVEEIIPDRRERNVIANDIANQLEKCENQHEHDKARQHQHEHPEEFAHHIGIEKPREKPARNNAYRARLKFFEQFREMGSVCLRPSLWLGCARNQVSDGAKNTPAAGHLPEQKTAHCRKQQIGHPHAEERRELSLAA